MPKRKGPEPKPEEQFREFVETARKLGVDESGKALEDAFKKLTSPSVRRGVQKAPQKTRKCD